MRFHAMFHVRSNTQPSLLDIHENSGWFSIDLLHLLENTFDRKLISTNPSLKGGV